MIFSQNSKKWNKVEFTQVIGNDVSNAELYFNSQESFYFLGNKSVVDTTTVEIHVRISDEIGSVMHKMLMDHVIYSREVLPDGVIMVKDSMPIIEWNISNEIKMVGTLSLTKATAKFRGRNYIAWFCENIPYNVGPLKLSNLPGIILELYTEDEFLAIRFNEIRFNIESTPDFELIFKHSREISQKEYRDECFKIADNMQERLNASMPRGTIVEIKVNQPLEILHE